MTAGDERLTLTVNEARIILGLSRGAAYEAIRHGQIPHIRVGRRILVPRAALERLLNNGGTALGNGLHPSRGDVL